MAERERDRSKDLWTHPLVLPTYRYDRAPEWSVVSPAYTRLLVELDRLSGDVFEEPDLNGYLHLRMKFPDGQFEDGPLLLAADAYRSQVEIANRLIQNRARFEWGPGLPVPPDEVVRDLADAVVVRIVGQGGLMIPLVDIDDNPVRTLEEAVYPGSAYLQSDGIPEDFHILLLDNAFHLGPLVTVLENDSRAYRTRLLEHLDAVTTDMPQFFPRLMRRINRDRELTDALTGDGFNPQRSWDLSRSGKEALMSAVANGGTALIGTSESFRGLRQFLAGELPMSREQ